MRGVWLWVVLPTKEEGGCVMESGSRFGIMVLIDEAPVGGVAPVAYVPPFSDSVSCFS